MAKTKTPKAPAIKMLTHENIKFKFWDLGTYTEKGRTGIANRLNMETIMDHSQADLAEKMAEIGTKGNKARVDRMVKATEQRQERMLNKLAKKMEKPGVMQQIGEQGIFGFMKNKAFKGAKVAGIAAGVLAVVGGAAYALRKSPKEETKANIDTAGMIAPPVDSDPMVGDPTLMGQVPTPGERAQAVLAARGGVGGPAVRA